MQRYVLMLAAFCLFFPGCFPLPTPQPANLLGTWQGTGSAVLVGPDGVTGYKNVTATLTVYSQQGNVFAATYIWVNQGISDTEQLAGTIDESGQVVMISQRDGNTYLGQVQGNTLTLSGIQQPARADSTQVIAAYRTFTRQ